MFDSGARYSFERLLILQPHVNTAGLWRVGDMYFGVCPDLSHECADDGTPIDEWFQLSCRVICSPITLTSSIPQAGEPVALRTSEELAYTSGSPFTERELLTAIHLSVPTSFPDFSVFSGIPGRVRVVVSRALSPSEEDALSNALEKLSVAGTVDVSISDRFEGSRSEFRSPYLQADLALIPSRCLPIGVSPSVRSAVEEDDEFWSSNRAKLLSTSDIVHPSDVLPAEFGRTGVSCLVNASAFPPENIRNYLSIYDDIVLVAPRGDNLEQQQRSLGTSTAELAELLTLGRVRLLLPHAIDRYDPKWVSAMLEAAPARVLLSRRLAAATVADTRRRWPFFYPPSGIAERRSILRALGASSSGSTLGRMSEWTGSLRATLAESWAAPEELLNDRGAMATSLLGVGCLGANLIKTIHGKDLTIEAWNAAMGVEWGAALGASVFPASTPGYDEGPLVDVLAGLHSGFATNRVPTVDPRVHAVLDGILSINNDIPVVGFAKEFGSGDIRRLRDTVQDMARWNVDESFLAEAIARFNADVRAVERRPDRLRSISVAALVPALVGAALPAADPLMVSMRSFAPIGLWVANAVLLVAGEQFADRSAGIGGLLDRMNGLLAGGKRPEAVLVSRVKKHVKILKG